MKSINPYFRITALHKFCDPPLVKAEDLGSGGQNINEKKNFKSMVEEFMQMQYDAGNISGYLFYKQFYDYMDGTDSKKDYSKFLEQYAEQIKEKIKNGETEPTYQIGGQSFNEEEWKKLVEKIDKDIEQIQAEQAERLEKQVQELLKDNNDRNFASYGPNAPEEVL